MIDRVPQRFKIGMLIDHRGAQVSVPHDVTNERWVFRLCHRVGAEGMPRVIEDDVLGDPRLHPRFSELTRNGCEVSLCGAPRRKHPLASVRRPLPKDFKDSLAQRHPELSPKPAKYLPYGCALLPLLEVFR